MSAPSAFSAAPARPGDRTLQNAATHALLIACGFGILYLFAQLLLFGYGRDQGIYAVVADTLLRGGMPYRDAWDFKPPGIFLVYALTRALFGSGQWAIRLMEVLALVSMIFAFIRYARRFFGDARVGIVGGFFAVLVYTQLEFWHTAQPESFGGVVIAWAMLLATFEPSETDASSAEQRRAQLLAWAGAGALYGFAGLLKPPLGGCAAVSAFFAARALARRGEPRRVWLAPVLAMAAGGTAVLLLCVLWFVARGAWSDLYETLFVFTPHYTRLSWDGVTVAGMFYLAVEEWLMFFSSTNFVGTLAALFGAPLADREREGILHLLGVVFVQLVGVTMQGKFFPYHYGAALPLGGLLAGLGAFKLFQYAAARGMIGLAAYATCAVVVFQGRSATRDTETDFWPRCLARQAYLLAPAGRRDRAALYAKLYSVADVSYGADQRVADFLRARISPDDPVYIWGFEPMIYDLSDRRPASRYIYDVPQRVEWSREGARRTLLADLDAHPARAIVVEHRDVFPAVTGDSIDSADTLKQFPELATRIAEHYRLDTRIEDFDIYLAVAEP